MEFLSNGEIFVCAPVENGDNNGEGVDSLPTNLPSQISSHFGRVVDG